MNESSNFDDGPFLDALASVSLKLFSKGWVGLGLGGTTGTGQTNDHARSKNSSLALCPPFTQNRCHFGRGGSNKIFPPLQEQSLTGATLTVCIY